MPVQYLSISPLVQAGRLSGWTLTGGKSHAADTQRDDSEERMKRDRGGERMKKVVRRGEEVGRGSGEKMKEKGDRGREDGVV